MSHVDEHEAKRKVAEGDRAAAETGRVDAEYDRVNAEGGRNLVDLYWRRAMTVWIIIFSVLVCYSIRENRIRSEEGIKARKVMCSIEVSTRERVANSEKYLDDVRSGVRDWIPGLTEADIVTSIRRDRTTLASFADLHC